MTIIDINTGLANFFEQDHRDCEARWEDVEELLDTEDIDEARPAWEKFDACMRRHMVMEEEVLFPAIEETIGASDGCPTEMMRMEHQQMKALLEKIGDAMKSGDAREALDIGDRLLMLVQQHNGKEESVLYPMSEDALGENWPGLAAKLEAY